MHVKPSLIWMEVVVLNQPHPFTHSCVCVEGPKSSFYVIIILL